MSDENQAISPRFHQAIGKPSIETPVLILGGGPVGLSTAIGLRKLGVECTVVERHPATLDFPKGRRVTVRSMEIFRQWDLEQAINWTVRRLNFYGNLEHDQSSVYPAELERQPLPLFPVISRMPYLAVGHPRINVAARCGVSQQSVRHMHER
jgi:2-polyprenyl-6-methoxyphenol hydroxylase-like FAD-dependent oxidoreductase